MVLKGNLFLESNLGIERGTHLLVILLNHLNLIDVPKLRDVLQDILDKLARTSQGGFW